MDESQGLGCTRYSRAQVMDSIASWYCQRHSPPSLAFAISQRRGSIGVESPWNIVDGFCTHDVILSGHLYFGRDRRNIRVLSSWRTISLVGCFFKDMPAGVYNVVD